MLITFLFRKSTLLFEIPIVRDLFTGSRFFSIKISTLIFKLTKALANVKLDKPVPRMQTLILILILTTKIR